MSIYEKYKTTSDSPTHLIMTGGKLLVEDEQKFITDYYAAICRGEKVSIVEKVDKKLKYKMFLDIDIKEELSDKRTFLEGLMSECEKNKPGCMAIICEGVGTHGIHVIFQRWNVDSKEANSFVSKLSYDIDTSVFNTGLRMPFSIKGKVDQYYYPKYLWKESKMTTLETKEEIYDIRLLEGCCIRTKYKTNYTPIQITETGGNVKNLMTRFVRSICQEYENINILTTKKIKNYITCLSDSKYCMNVGCSHGKNHVYFVIHNKVMYQKCHCKKYKCDTFKSKPYNIPWNLLEELKKV